MNVLYNMLKKGVNGIDGEKKKNKKSFDFEMIRNEYRRYTNSAMKLEFDRRQIENDGIWKMRHKNGIKGESDKVRAKSGYIFNAVIQKHADAMDNYPEINILPREAGDIDEAKTLTKVIPCVMDLCDFKKTYSDNWYAKLKNGTAVYGVFWNPSLYFGLGDIEIKKIDIVNLAFEPGVSDIEESKYIFYTYSVSKESFISEYGSIDGAEFASPEDKKYNKNDTEFISERVKVIDCYYKKPLGGANVVHFLKFSGKKILYSSEKEGKESFYAHGYYPFVFDVLYPYEDSPLGFGIVDVLYHTQTQVDKLDEMILKNASLCSSGKILASKSLGINKAEILNAENEYVEFDGAGINDSNFKEFRPSPIPQSVVGYRDTKISEIKEVIGNRDFQQGGTQGGVTAASAITVLQAAGDKLTRDYIDASYRAYRKITLLVIELIRQFYSVERNFRITGSDVPEFVRYDNTNIAVRSTGKTNADGITENGQTFRKPEFDVVLSVQKKNPYTREMQNQTIIELLKAGLFNPQNIDVSLIVLDALQFEGKENIIEKLSALANKQNNAQNMQGVQDMQNTQDVPNVQTLAEVMGN